MLINSNLDLYRNLELLNSFLYVLIQLNIFLKKGFLHKEIEKFTSKPNLHFFKKFFVVVIAVLPVLLLYIHSKRIFNLYFQIKIFIK